MASILVTGTSSGIGRACALRLDELGHRVFAGVRSQGAGDSLRVEASERLVPVILDVTVPEQVAAAVGVVDEHVGDAGLDGLVNNAGIAKGGPVEHLPMEEWREQFEVNLFGQVAVTQAMLPAIRRAAGRIVFVGSVAGLVSSPLGGPYGASKHAIEAVAESLGAELHPWGIQVALVEPGLVSTPIWDKGAGDVDRVTELMGPLAEERYGDAMRRLESKVGELAGTGKGPERAVAAIEHALFDPRPRLRYPAGGDARIVAVAHRLLPDRALAWLLRRSGP